jgi:tetratricopeptide (TPR) repeat protein
MRALALVAALLAAGPALAAAPSPEAVSRKDQGDARREAGDNTGALAAYREALQLSPDYIEAWEEIGKLYFAAKKFGEAGDAFQRAVDIDASYSNNWFNLALARRRAGDLARSRDAFRRYLALKPDDADGRLRLADVLRALDDREGATREYEAVVAAAEARAIAPALGDRAKEGLAQLRASARPVPTIVQITPVPSPTEAPPPMAPSAAPVAAPASAPAYAAPAAPPRPAQEPATPPSPALLDKLALGEKLQNAGDYRGALFAFQDAVYLEPRNAIARVKLGRAYWALRYVGQADEQWQQATQLAPNDPSIARMIEEARKAPRPALASEPSSSPPASPPSSGPSSPAPTPAPTPAPVEGTGGPRVYRLAPETQGGPSSPSSPPQYSPPPREPVPSTPGYGLPPAQPSTGGQTAYPQQGYSQPAYPPAQQQPAYPTQQGYPAQQGYVQQGYPPAQQQPAYPPQGYDQPGAAQSQPPAYPQTGYPQTTQPLYPPPAYEVRSLPQQYAPPAPPQQPSAAAAAAATRYRAALSLYVQRDYLGAIAELDAAITLDPNLAVAYTARGSSKFGLRKYREAAGDYKASLDLDPTKAEPIWGLAECQRMLNDPAAADTYRRYAASIAGDVNEDRRSKARRWATELSGQGR